MADDYWSKSGRHEANERSREFAHRDRQPWTDEDDEFIDAFWIQVGPQHREEAEVAKALGRTIEACRMRAHHLINPEGIRFVVYKKTVETVYIGLLDEPEDRWWER